MKRWAFALLLFLGGGAQAATLQIVNGLGAADFMNGVRDSNNAFSARSIVCDGTNPDTCAPVSAVNGLTVTVSNASAMPTNLTQVNGTGFGLGQATMSASIPVVIASNQASYKVGVVGNAAGLLDFIGQNASAPGNSLMTGCMFVTSPTTVTSGNVTPVQCDSKGSTLTDLASINTTTVLTGAGATGAGAQRVTVAQDTTTVAGSTPGTASTVSATITNPTSTLTLPSTTTAYTAGQLIATSATAGSVVNPSFAIANSAGGALITRLRLSTNDTTSTAWGAQTIRVDLWTTTPTWTNGDRGTWSPATQTGAHLGAYTCTMSAEYGDGAFAECAPVVGNFSGVKLASGTSVFWSLDAISGSGVTGASKVFTLTAEILN